MSPRKMVSLKADIPPSKAVAAQETVGTPNKLGVYVHGGKTLVGRVGRKATAVAVARFGSHFAKLGKDADGNDAWIGMTLAELSAKGPQQPALRAGSTMTKVTAS